MLFPVVEPIFFVQSPKLVLMIFAGDAQIRHVYLDVPHSTHPKPSWYGESVGRYQGDTLLIDTVGFNDTPSQTAASGPQQTSRVEQERAAAAT
jgi:hypothetical protein